MTEIFKKLNFDNQTLVRGILLSTLVIFAYRIFFDFEHFPIHDEIITLDRYLRFDTFLIRTAPNNHVLLSLYGTIINSIFGYNFLILRIGVFLFLPIIFYYYQRIFPDNILLVTIFIFIISQSAIIFNYIYLFRGFYLSSLLTVIIFFLLFEYNKHQNDNNLKIIFFICGLLTIHSLYTLYIVVPVILSILIFSKKKNFCLQVKNLIFFYFPHTIIFFSVSAFLTGFVFEHSGNLNLDFLIKNFFKIFINSSIVGFKWIISDGDMQNQGAILSLSRIKTIFSFLSLLHTHAILFSIFFISFIISIFKIILKKKNILDFTIFFFIIFFLIINKDLTSSYTRIYIGFVYFFIFYLIYNLNLILNKFIFLKIKPNRNFLFTYFIILNLIIFFTTKAELSNKTADTESLENHVVKIQKYTSKCDLINTELNDYENWIFLNYFPNYCYYYYDEKQKKNIFSSKKIDDRYRKKKISFHQ